MTNQISASRALSTLKTLTTNIGIQISSSKFSFLKKGSKNLENGKTHKIDTFSAEKTFKNYTKDEEKLNFTLNDGEVLTFELKELE